MDTTRHHPLEVAEAGADLVRMSLQARGEYHPLAEGGLRLPDVAAACAQLQKGFTPTKIEAALVQRGIGSREFSRVLANGARPAIEAAYEIAAEHLPVCSIVDVDNYLPADIANPMTDIGLEPLAEGGEAQRRVYVAKIKNGERTAQLREFKRIVALTRQAIFSNQITEWSRAVSSLGASAARIEARLIADELEENGNLEDGAPIFGPDNIVSKALAADALGEGMATMRAQPVEGGQPCGLRARFLMVAPGLEYEASALVHGAGLRLEVVVLTGLSTGRWYLLADPAAAPTVGVLRLAGARLPIRVEEHQMPLRSDDAGVVVGAELGAVVLRRLGIVQGGS